MNTRMDRSKFHLAIYGLYHRTPAYVRACAECGVDFVLSAIFENESHLLDEMYKYGLGCIRFCYPLPHWGGEGYGYLGRMPEKFPLEECYIAPSRTFKDHPALWGLDIADEPSAMDFPYLGKIAETVNYYYPNQFPYFNLYPEHGRAAESMEDAINSDFGTLSYEDYLDRFCENIDTHYISYDFYLYGGAPEWRDWTRGGKLSRFYENFRLVSDKCHKYGKDFWVIMLGNSWEGQPYRDPPSQTLPIELLRFQAYSAMAFGVKSIAWWESWICDTEGNITEQHGRLKQMNQEIRTIAEEYMKYRNVHTHFVGFDGYPDLTSVQQKGVPALNNGVFFDLKSDMDTPLVIGQMINDEDGSHALMISMADDPFNENPLEYNITFRAGGRAVRAIGGDGPILITKHEDGSYSVPVHSNMGLLLIAR